MATDLDDDMIIIIVDDDNRELSEHINPIKTEPSDEREDNFENIIQIAEAHGQYVKFKVELEESPEIADQNENFWLDENFENVEFIEDEQYSVKKMDMPSHKLKPVNIKSTKKRKWPRTGEEKSFIQELRERYPELKDRRLLLDTVCEIMRSMKMPKTPPNCYDRIDNYYECNICLGHTESESMADRHYQEKHGPRYLICFACGVDFRSTTNLYKHEKRCGGPDAHIVLRARAQALGNMGRSRPYINHKRNTARVPKKRKRYPCTMCSASFLTKDTLESHLNLHNGVRPYQCATCPAAYTSNVALSRHEKKHSDEQYICDHCGRVFKSKAALVPHMNTHKPSAKFVCSLCGRGYSQRLGLRLHVDRVHRHLPPPCACQICPKRYPRMSLLKNHMMNEHGLDLMTRMMLLKRLPTLSESQMKQAAKVIFKTDTEPQNNHLVINPNEQFGDDDENSSVPDVLSSEEVIDNSNDWSEVIEIKVKAEYD